MKIRFATDQDGPAVAALVEEVLKEYGDRICLDAGGSEEDVLQIQSAYFNTGGAFWVLESEDSPTIIGCNAVKRSLEEAGTVELKRMYLAKAARGSGAAAAMLDASLEWAAERFFAVVELWSDSRFERGHRFYQKHGFAPSGRFRDMDDSHEPYRELHFSRRLI